MNKFETIYRKLVREDVTDEHPLDEIYSIIDEIYTIANRAAEGRYPINKNSVQDWYKCRDDIVRKKLKQRFDISDEDLKHLMDNFGFDEGVTTVKKLFKQEQLKKALKKTSSETQDTFNDLLESHDNFMHWNTKQLRECVMDNNLTGARTCIFNLLERAYNIADAEVSKNLAVEEPKKWELIEEATIKVLEEGIGIPHNIAMKTWHEYFSGEQLKFDTLIDCIKKQEMLKKVSPETKDTFNDLLDT